MSDTPPDTLKSLIIRWREGLTFLTTAGLIFYGGYWFGELLYQSRLATYEELTKLDLPSLSREATNAAQSLRMASAEFETMLVNNRTYEEMKNRYIAARERVADLENEKRTALAQLEKVRAVLSETFEVGKLHAVRTSNSVSIGSLLNVGLTSLGMADAQLNINGTVRTVSPGDFFEVNATNDRPCKIRVLNLHYVASTLDFTADCSAALKQ